MLSGLQLSIADVADVGAAAWVTYCLRTYDRPDCYAPTAAVFQVCKLALFIETWHCMFCKSDEGNKRSCQSVSLEHASQQCIIKGHATLESGKNIEYLNVDDIDVLSSNIAISLGLAK
ncbi:hypothetical protein D918_05954 [Trichuris suis]|nr:hypothetical protein D918_05954 [Trichuris suis]